jgi:hypothetical protein
LKAKGTLPALRTLITSYGIPDTVLRITEFGGKDKSNTNDWDYWQNTFNYSYYNSGSNTLSTEWELNGDWASPNNVPSTLAFRFKIKDLLQISGSSPQTLWKNGAASTIQINYTGSGYSSGSYSGSIIDPYYQYAQLKFYPDGTNFPNLSASIYLPFCDEDWWSVAVTRNNDNFVIYAGNKEYEGGDNNTVLGFYASSSINVSSTSWISLNPSSVFLLPPFNGYLQEVRYYNTVISESVFKDYIMNPHSIEGNTLNSSPDNLAFRASLGGELYTGSISIHPKVTGSWVTTSSFTSNSNFTFSQTPIFAPNEEYFFYDQVAAGIRNAVSDKIRLENSVMPSGDTLSPFRSLAQNVAISQSYTANTNLLEVAFSPQDEINEDIMDQIGYFNIGELIGDPRQRSSSATSYPALDNLRNAYFEKYTKNYDLNDFIRLIKFFDNSLFKMIKDFIPARTSLASGVVIKQTLLERNKYPQPQVNNQSTIAYTTSGSQNNVPFTFQNILVSGTVAPQWNDYQEGTVENFDGGAGGVFNTFNTVTNTSQSWYETIPTISGSVIMLHNSQDEFYDGEFSGSTLIVTTQSLSQPYPLENIASSYKQVHYYPTSSTETSIFENNFLNNVTSPQSGSILFYNEPVILFGSPTYQLFVTKYLKIAKIDCSGTDNTNVLGNINKAVIYDDVIGTYVNYDLIVLNEFPTYYLYGSSNRLYAPSLFPNQVDYQVSASRITPSFTITAGNNNSIQSLTESIDNLNYFTPSTGLLTFGDTPNTPIVISASLSLNSSANSNINTIVLVQNGDVNDEYVGSNILSNTFTLSSGANTVLFTGSFYPLTGNTYYLRIFNESSPFDTGTTTFNSIQLQFSQSRAVSSSACAPVIFEPYITLPNYYNSDYNPLINNTEGERLSTKFQDVDYSTGIATPTNFALLISGSAVKAAVQDSNYSSKRVILPRYEGSKTTSQHLNYWTPGDSGTYGKLPSVENLKTAVAYCDWIGGWPPDRMNASAIHVLYLIKADGTVVIPNTSQNSLTDIKGNFESGENIFITAKTVSSGQPQQARKIIRGGTRIEPILYNQSGSMPGGTFVNSITLTDNGVTGGVVSDFQAKLRPTSYTLNQLSLTPTFSELCLNQILSTGSQASLSTQTISGTTSYRYQVNSNVVSEGVSLTLDIYLEATYTGGGPNPYYQARIVRWRGGNKTSLIMSPSILINNTYEVLNLSITIPFNDLQLNDEFAIEGVATSANVYVEQTSRFNIYQNPIPNSSVSITSNFWISSSGLVTTLIKSQTSGAFGDNLLITSCSSALINYYGSPSVYQEDIAGSGFNPIVTPWSIQYGDEFRFEGREDRLYQVKQATVVNLQILSSQIPLLVVEMNQPLATSGSVNFNQFEIRRYVDDASQIIMEGFKPADSSGPYIVRPEFIVPELNKSVDQFILDLTQKGLIT